MSHLLIHRLQVVARVGQYCKFLTEIGYGKMHFCKCRKSLHNFLAISDIFHCIFWYFFTHQDINAKKCRFFLKILSDKLNRLLTNKVNSNGIRLRFLGKVDFSDVLNTDVQEILHSDNFLQDLSSFLVSN